MHSYVYLYYHFHELNSLLRLLLGSRGVGWAVPRTACYQGLRGDTAVLRWAPDYSPGVNVNKRSLSPPKTIYAW